MKWIKSVISTFRCFSVKEQWIHGICWFLGLIIINWPGQQITIGIFHKTGFQLLFPSLYGSVLNAALFYGVMNLLIRNTRPFNLQLLTKTFIIFVTISLTESVIDDVHYFFWVNPLSWNLVKEALLTNVMINFFFFYIPSLTYGIVKRALLFEQNFSRIAVQDGRQVVYIDAKDLLFLESDGNYVKFHQRSKVVLERTTLIEVLTRLPKQFIRCHKSFIVNSDLIDQKSTSEIVIGDQSIPIGRKFKENLRQD